MDSKQIGSFSIPRLTNVAIAKPSTESSSTQLVALSYAGMSTNISLLHTCDSKDAIGSLPWPIEQKQVAGRSTWATSLHIACDLIFISNRARDTIVVATLQGLVVCTIPCPRPLGMCVDEASKELYVSSHLSVVGREYRNYQIAVFSLGGNPIRTFGETGPGDGELWYPNQLAFYSERGQLFVVDYYYQRIQVLTPCGHLIRVIRTRDFGIRLAGDLCFDYNTQTLLVLDGEAFSANVHAFKWDGVHAQETYRGSMLTKSEIPKRVSCFNSICVDTSTNRLFVADATDKNSHIKVFDAPSDRRQVAFLACMLFGDSQSNLFIHHDRAWNGDNAELPLS